MQRPTNRMLMLMKDYLLPVVIFVLLMGVMISGIVSVTASYETNALNYSTQALTKTVIQCYAFEGHYPTSLEYLVENYGLILDKDRFVYHYQYLGDNILPEMSVFRLED